MADWADLADLADIADLSKVMVLADSLRSVDLAKHWPATATEKPLGNR